MEYCTRSLNAGAAQLSRIVGSLVEAKAGAAQPRPRRRSSTAGAAQLSRIVASHRFGLGEVESRASDGMVVGVGRGGRAVW